MTKSYSIRKAITSFHYLHTRTYQKKHMSFCPSGWYQFLKIWPLAHGLCSASCFQPPLPQKYGRRKCRRSQCISGGTPIFFHTEQKLLFLPTGGDTNELIYPCEKWSDDH